MKKLFYRYIVLILPVAFLFMFSCTPETCFEETEAFLKASFYPDGTEKALAPDSVTIYGLDMVSNKLYNKTKKVATALLPLNPSAESSIFIIRINGVTDTLEFRYSSYPHLVSKECGYTFFYNLNEDPISTNNIIKGIYRTESNITIIDEENIRIFY